MREMIHRPSAAEVAGRLLVLKHQYAYVAALPPADLLAGWLANASAQDKQELPAALDKIRVAVCDSLEGAGLWPALTPDERQLFGKAPTAVTERDAINTSWGAEAAVCLGWALGLIPDLPEYDEQVDADLLKGFGGDDLPRFVNTAALRPLEEIDRARDVAELWHWRSRTRELQEQGFTPPADSPLKSLTEIVSAAAEHAHQRGEIPRPIAGDFPSCGKAYRDLTSDEWARVRSVAVERHRALNWLCGFARGNRWQETPTDT